MGVSDCERYEELVDDLRNSSRVQSLNIEYRVNEKSIELILRLKQFAFYERISLNFSKKRQPYHYLISFTHGMLLILCLFR